MKNHLRYLLLSLIATVFLFAGMNYSELLFIPWGAADAELGYQSYVGLQTGPSSFQVLGKEIIILDNENKAIKTFTKEGFQESELLSFPGALDLFRNDGDFYLATPYEIYRQDRQGWMESRREQDPKKVFMGFFRRDNEMYMRYPNELRTVNTALKKDANSVLRLERHLPDKLLFDFGSRTVELRIPDIGSLDYLGSGGGLHYIYAESIVQHAPVLVDRFVLVLDEKGNSKGRINLPRNQFVYMFREFDVSPEGVLYHMQSSESGIHIIRWEYNSTLGDESASYPEKFSQIPHFNGKGIPEPESANPVLNKSGAATAAGVERSETLEIADAHVRHVWVATAANIGVTSTVTTPEWIKIGENVSIPYKWGGWNTIAQFDAGIAAGKLAGDRNTSVVDWGNSVGNDCSGYVSICWKTGQKYGTATLSNVSRNLASVNDLLPGDATNKSGSHVRLFVEWTNDGKLLQAEATSSGNPGWFTRYYTWTISGISGYVPIRYNKIQGMMGPSTTFLYTVSDGDSVKLAWEADESVDFSGYKVFRKLNSEKDFTLAATLAKGTRTLRLAQAEERQYDYKISSYIQGEAASETSSDIYAVKRSSAGKQILIVDGFDRFGGSGSYPYPTHDFAARTGDALDCRNLAYESCANEAIIEGLVDLRDYDLVWWILGDESTEDETFSTAEQSKVKEYLNAGGKLFVSGSEIGWDLDNKGTAADKAFIHEYLKAKYKEDASGSYQVSGAVGSIFEGLQFAFSKDGSHPGTFPEDYPDVLDVVNGSKIALKYGNNKTAAVHYEGKAPGSNNEYRVMVMGFPFETITTAASKIELAGFILRFMGYDVELSTVTRRADTFELYPNYPNPFNPLTTIAYQLDNIAEVSLDIFNLQGMHIACLQKGPQAAGRYELQFDGTNLASGVYLYRLSVNQDIQKVQKMTLLK